MLIESGHASALVYLGMNMKKLCVLFQMLFAFNLPESRYDFGFSYRTLSQERYKASM